MSVVVLVEENAFTAIAADPGVTIVRYDRTGHYTLRDLLRLRKQLDELYDENEERTYARNHVQERIEQGYNALELFAGGGARRERMLD